MSTLEQLSRELSVEKVSSLCWLAQSSKSSLSSLYSVFDSEGTPESALSDVDHPPGGLLFRPCFSRLLAVGDLIRAVGPVRYRQIAPTNEATVVERLGSFCRS